VRLLTATLRIYVDAARDARKAFPRSAWAFFTLLTCFPLLTAVSMLVSPLGILGGIVVSLLNAACAGTYLALLKDAVGLRKPLSFDGARANMGAHTWDILGVLFPLYLVDLVFTVFGAPWVVTLVFGIAVAIFLNPIPEMIGRTRSASMELLAEAWNFMMRSGPEWLAPQVVALAALWLVYPQKALSILALFGPRFGFTTTGSLAMGAGGGAAGWAFGFALVALVHLTMLFRGALYERISSAGGRRAREWQERTL
jgi:hypothetical protein